MKANPSTALLGVTAMLGGCTTTLGVQHHPSDGLSEGIPHTLPFTRYEITATWRLASCGDASSTEPKIVLSVAATAGAEDDPDHTYLIDATSLQRPMTTANFTVAYHEGSNTLKTVNAEVEDRTAQIIGDVARTVVALAPLANPMTALISGARSADRGSSRPLTIQCSRDARDALDRVNRLKDSLEASNADVAAKTDEVARLATIVARMGGAVDQQTSASYGRALEQLAALTAAQADLATQLADALKAVTHQQVIRWPDAGTEIERDRPMAIDANVLARWFGNDATAPGNWPRAFLAIERVVPGGAVATTPASGARIRGIPYRLAVRGRLVTCPMACSSAAADTRRSVLEGPVAQLGGIDVLRVSNPPFGSTTFAATFNRDGTLVSAGYGQRNAPLEQAAGAVAGAAGAVTPLFDPTARINSQTAYLEALKKRRDAAAALQPVPVNQTAEMRGSLEAETTLLNAQIANIEARRKLQGLQAGSGGQ